MNNRKLEKYFSPFSRKEFNCVVLFGIKELTLVLSVLTETTPEKHQATKEDWRRTVF